MGAYCCQSSRILQSKYNILHSRHKSPPLKHHHREMILLVHVMGTLTHVTLILAPILFLTLGCISHLEALTIILLICLVSLYLIRCKYPLDTCCSELDLFQFHIRHSVTPKALQHSVFSSNDLRK